MRLDDTIHRLSNATEIPAYVYTQRQTTAEVTWDYEQVAFEQRDTMRAIIKGPDDWQRNEIVRWDGTEYVISYIARRKRRGRVHHITLTMELVSDEPI